MFQQLFEYTFQKNKELIEVFLTDKKSLPVLSLKLISHILNAHHIWNSRIVGKKSIFGVWELQPVSLFNEINLQNHKDSQFILEEYNTEDVIYYQNSKGDFFNNSVGDILFHIINHSTYHRGQIAMDFRQNAIEPLLSDYIFYKR